MIGRIIFFYILIVWLYSTYTYIKEKDCYVNNTSYLEFCFNNSILITALLLILFMIIGFLLFSITMIIQYW